MPRRLSGGYVRGGLQSIGDRSETSERLRGVVDDDAPAFGSFFHDEGEDAIGVAAGFFGAFEVVFAEGDGEVLVERMDFEVGEGEGAHGGAVGVIAVVAVKEAGEAAVDLAREEEGVGRVFVGLGEGVEITGVPGALLGEEDLDAAEFDGAGGVERLRLGGGGRRRGQKRNEEGKSEGAGGELHKET